ncbi:hypothetical protein KC952_03005 [Candidatus Saccharibacteria bacterium]|jgi:hypothetical protein|nr:hypothetical protein [Candidatus Saccharibacteria bacterium]
MGLYVRQENTRSKLQEKIAADLAEKSKKKFESGEQPSHDGINDSAYMENTKNTTSLAAVWLVLIIIGVAILVWLVVASS